MSIRGGFRRYGLKIVSVVPAIVAVVSIILSLHLGMPATHAHLGAISPVSGEDDIFM
ncbi:MAG: hypothetical protein F7B61_06620 [Caldisphaeraceae archaeon]|nr:hypothetical protein [Caldisphaeraceae archaeon]